MRFIKTISILICFLASFQAFGQPSLSLSQAIEIGLKNNFQIQIAEKNTEIAQKNDHWATAGRVPTINFLVNANNGYASVKNPASVFRESDSYSGNVSGALDLNWTLFDGHRVLITKNQLEELTRQSEGNEAIVVENVIHSIILAYYQALIQKEQVGVLEEVLTLSRDRIGYEEVRKEFGQSGTFELLQANDAYLNDSTNYLIQTNSYETALRNLNLAMGLEDLNRPFTLSDQLNFEVPSYDLKNLQDKAFAENKNLQNLFVNRELANINTQLQNSTRSPTLSLNTGLSYAQSFSDGTGLINIGGMEQELDLSGGGSTANFYFNLSARYNIFDGGVKKRNIENAKIQELIAQLSIDDQKQQLGAQIENTLATYDQQRALVFLTEQLIENAKRNLEIADERLRGGLITSFDYRTVQLNYINAAQARLNAIFNLKITETELVRLTGGLVR